MDSTATIQWLKTGTHALSRMIEAIRNAKRCVRIESYIIKTGEPTLQIRHELIAACKRGCQVKILADALGSNELPDSFWNELRRHGGEVRRFNPLSLHRIAFRDHRKMLASDETLAIVGGFNIGPEYLSGDGIAKGWRDLGMEVRGPMVHGLVAAFDDMYRRADFKHPPLARLRKSLQTAITNPEGRILLGNPGRNSRIKNAIAQDLKTSTRVSIISPYFLPTWAIRREITRAARRQGKVRLILPAKTDVALSYFAAQRYYGRLLRAGVEIYEYQPQILHAKLMVFDNIVYTGSCNLDSRSLGINYELLLRFEDPALAAQAEGVFHDVLSHCRRVNYRQWRHYGGFFHHLKVRWAYFLLARVDPMLARYQWRRLLHQARNACKRTT
jgi:cardiolipin synthase